MGGNSSLFLASKTGDFLQARVFEWFLFCKLSRRDVVCEIGKGGCLKGWKIANVPHQHRFGVVAMCHLPICVPFWTIRVAAAPQALSKDAPTGSPGVCTTGGSARALTFSGAVMPFCLFLGCFLSTVCSVLGLHLDTSPPHWVVESEMLCSTRRLQVVWWLTVGNPLC